MMKDEIKKALKCCETDFCCRCPYYEYRGCEAALKRYALDLITEQEKEIKRLKEEKKQAKIDVLNELKDGYEVDISTSNDCDMVVRVDDIDELIKEVENEQ